MSKGQTPPSAPASGADHPLKVLIADDDPDILVSGRFLFRNEGWSVTQARSPREALAAIEKDEFDAALVDMNYARNTTAGREGLDLVTEIRKADPDLPVIVMTAWGTIDLAISAIKCGACDFVQKPWDNVRVVQQLKTAASACRALRKSRLLEEENRLLRGEGASPDFVCKSASMRKIMDVVDQVAPSKANILLLGENGTGKSLLARIVHERSALREGPFISVNVGGLPEGLFESEMFGHVKGAFTDAKADRVGRFELAKGGTLFLDEIGNITLSQQNRLLRLLETGEYERVGSSRTLKADVRIISATNSNLRAAVQAGNFREDLFFRLNTVTMELPPLRDRREDIVELASRFVAAQARKYGRKIKGLDPSAEEAILAHTWPGNIRELSHAMERAVLMCRGETIVRHDLSIEPDDSAPASLESMSIEEVEQVLIRKALDRNEGNVSKAAADLGMSRATFYRRLKEQGK
jgi:DNA-binding NtrC family response regulator